MEFDIKEKVLTLAEKRGMTGRELAKKMGVSYNSLFVIMTRNPTYSSLKKLADALDVEVAEFFSNVPEPYMICPHCGKKITATLSKYEDSNNETDSH